MFAKPKTSKTAIMKILDIIWHGIPGMIYLRLNFEIIYVNKTKKSEVRMAILLYLNIP